MNSLPCVEENTSTLLNHHEALPWKSAPGRLLPMQPAPGLQTTRIQLRHGTADDMKFFFEIEEQTTWESLPPDKAQTVSREQLRQNLRRTHQSMLGCQGNVFFIAEAMDDQHRERVGLLWFGLRHNLLTGEPEAWIYNVTTVAAWRGRGIARQMMEHAEDHARSQGHDVIGLCVAVHNEIARDCYARLDYEPSNIILRKVLTPALDTVRAVSIEPNAANNFCGNDVLLK